MEIDRKKLVKCKYNNNNNNNNNNNKETNNMKIEKNNMKKLATLIWKKKTKHMEI